MNKTGENWDLIIEPRTSLLKVPIKDVWRYKDLLFLFVKRDFISFYKQTILGPIWFFLQPLFTTLIYVIIFGKLAGISTDGLPAPLFYLVGIIAWNYFAECLIKTSTVFKDNASIFGKVYFPRLIMPISVIISNLIKFGVQLLLLVFVYLYYVYFNDYELQLNKYILLFPVAIVLMAILGLGMGMIISAATTKYRDLAFLVAFGVQLLMYATPVIYPLSSAPGRFRNLINLNPISSIVEVMRLGTLGKGLVTFDTFLYSALFSLCCFLIGVIIFNKVEKDFVDTI